MISGFLALAAKNEKTILMVLAAGLFVYFFMMDVILYVTLQAVTLVDPPKVNPTGFSPFYPLSIKLLTSDHVNNYIITPTSEGFNNITKFSKVFYFITPNMISITHLAIGFLSAKMIYSESLKSRRIGVLLYEFRMWLDAFDGTVYRARSGDHHYVSNHSTLGYWVDVICDTTSGFLLCFAILFYLWKWPPSKDHKLEVNENETLPWKVPPENGSASEQHIERPNGKPSKKFMFWRTFCFGAILGLASITWDRTVVKYEAVFETKLATPELVAVQTTDLHSTNTWIIFTLWRLLQGQAWIQMVLIAVFIDKVWEFFRVVQYFGLVIMIILNVVSEVHVRHVRQRLGLPDS